MRAPPPVAMRVDPHLAVHDTDTHRTRQRPTQRHPSRHRPDGPRPNRPHQNGPHQNGQGRHLPCPDHRRLGRSGRPVPCRPPGQLLGTPRGAGQPPERDDGPRRLRAADDLRRIRSLSRAPRAHRRRRPSGRAGGSPSAAPAAHRHRQAPRQARPRWHRRRHDQRARPGLDRHLLLPLRSAAAQDRLQHRARRGVLGIRRAVPASRCRDAVLQPRVPERRRTVAHCPLARRRHRRPRTRALPRPGHARNPRTADPDPPSRLRRPHQPADRREAPDAPAHGALAAQRSSA